MKKQNSVAWFQMPTNLISDTRIEHLIDSEGCSGLGAYLLLLTELYRRQSNQTTIKKLKKLDIKGVTSKRIVKIITEYGLFTVDEYDHVMSAIDYCDIRSNFLKGEMPKDSEELSDEQSGEQPDDKPDELPSPAHEEKSQSKSQSSSSYRRRNCAADDNGPFKLNLSARRVASVDEIIEQMKTPSAWSEAVIMSSGFCKLLHDNWDKALRWFRLHITERSKEGEILTVEDARRYFADLIHHPTTAALIQNYLQQLADKDRPYPYEDPTSRPGHRSYLGGTPLPDDAPSRPGPRHEWVLGRWEEF